jgi:large subunit ribosomal protein L25
MEKIELKANRRKVKGRKVRALRREGFLPGVVYGYGIEPISIELNEKEVSRYLSSLSGSTLVDLDVEGETHKVLVREMQRDVIYRHPIHVDFLRVALDVRINAIVPVELVGVSPAVRDLGGVLVTGLTEVEVEALPTDLPDRLTVDLNAIKGMHDTLTVADLVSGEGVEILTDPEELIARVVYQAVEEVVEEELVEEMPAGVEPELIERGKAEEEEEDND